MMRTIFFLGAVLLAIGSWSEGPWVWAGTGQFAKSQQQTVSLKTFEQAIYVAMTRHYGRPDHRLSLQILFPKKPINVPQGKVQLEVDNTTGGARMGRRAFRVHLFVSGKFLKTMNVVTELKARAVVAIPMRWLKPREIVQAEDVRMMMVNLPSLTHDFILDREQAVGKQVLRPLPPRQPIQRVKLDDPPTIQKGDRVMLEVRQGGLLVQTVGLAQAAGKSGDTIPVQNQHSGREVIGTIVGSGLVQVAF